MSVFLFGKHKLDSLCWTNLDASVKRFFQKNSKKQLLYTNIFTFRRLWRKNNIFLYSLNCSYLCSYYTTALKTNVLDIEECIRLGIIAAIRVMTDNLSMISISAGTNYRERVLRSFITSLRNLSTKPTYISFYWSYSNCYTWNLLSSNYAAPNTKIKQHHLSSFDECTDSIMKNGTW